MKTPPALLLAFALFLSGCASPLALRLDEHGAPVVKNSSGRELHDVTFRVVSVDLDGRTAFDDVTIPTWIVDDWRQAPSAALDRIAAMEVRGECKEIKNMRATWQAPWTQFHVTTWRY